MADNDLRLIEKGFPCHQVGAETQRERGMSTALPAHFALHVWWARRPLIPSRAAIVASLAPADTDPEEFVRSLGIEKKVALVNGETWTLTGRLLDDVTVHSDGTETLEVTPRVLRELKKEQQRRTENRSLIARLTDDDPTLGNDPVLKRWRSECQPISEPLPNAT